jgi:hypothetical protein
MSGHIDDLDLTLRPPWHLLAFGFLVGGGMLLFGCLVIGPVLGAPAWVRCVFVAGPLLVLLVGLHLS